MDTNEHESEDVKPQSHENSLPLSVNQRGTEVFEIRKCESGNILGPFSANDLKRLAREGFLKIEDEIRNDSGGKWQSVNKVKGLTFSAASVVVEDMPEDNPFKSDLTSFSEPEEDLDLPDPAVFLAAADKATAAKAATQEDVLCNFCCETIKAGAKKCKHCGELLDPVLRQAAAATSARKKDTGVAAVLSFLVPGLGQLYLENFGASIGWFIGTIIGYCLLIIPGISLHVMCVIDALTPKSTADSGLPPQA